MAIADKLIQVNEEKEAIKQALINQSVDMTDVPFIQYHEKVASIKQSTGDALESDVRLGKTFSNSSGIDKIGTWSGNLDDGSIDYYTP